MDERKCGELSLEIINPDDEDLDAFQEGWPGHNTDLDTSHVLLDSFGDILFNESMLPSVG